MKVSKHTKDRMVERNITVQEVTTTLQYGRKMVNKWDSNKLTFVDYSLNCYVVVDKDLTTIITVFRKEY